MLCTRNNPLLLTPTGWPQVICRAAAALVILLAVAFLTGCGKSMSGTYEDTGSASNIEFKDGGKVYVTLMGATAAGEYEVDGERIILKTNGQSLVLTQHGDTLEGGPFGMKFVKK